MTRLCAIAVHRIVELLREVAFLGSDKRQSKAFFLLSQCVLVLKVSAEFGINRLGSKMCFKGKKVDPDPTHI